jgi:hypothetical protein
MVKLRHLSLSEGEHVVHFYDGELTAEDGVLDVPNDRPEWVRAAWAQGFRLDPKSGDFLTFDVVEGRMTDSAKSAGAKTRGKNTSSGGRTVS